MAEISNKTLRDAVSKGDGRIPVYLLKDKRVRRVAPVDARDLIQADLAALHEPIIQMQSPAGPQYVKHSEVEKREAEKWTVIDNAPAEIAPPPPPPPYDFAGHAVPQLREFAAKAGISVPNGINKDKLVELLVESGFHPETETKDED